MVEREYIESAFLGQGYNSLTRELRNIAIEYDPKDLTRENVEGTNPNDNQVIHNNRQKSLLYFKLINSVNELANSLNISAGAKFGFLSSHGAVSAKASFLKEQEINNQYFYVLIRYVVENESYRIKKPKLTEEAKKLLKSHNGVEKFRKRFGDEFIVGFKTGGEYIALIKSLSGSKREDEAFAADIQAQLNFIVARIGVEGSYNSQNSQRIDNRALEVASFRSGCKEFGFAVSLEEIGKK